MIEVLLAPSEMLPAAVELQFQRFPAAERADRLAQLYQSLASGELQIQACLTVLERGELIAVSLMVGQRDGAIYIWPAQVASRVSPPNYVRAVRAAIYQRACEIIDASGTWIGQTLLEDNQRDISRELDEHGLHYLTDLFFMNRSLTVPIEVNRALPELSWCEFDEANNRTYFAEMVARSYEGTLDCPELNNSHRSAEQALDSHKLSGQFSPARWRLFQHAGQDVGVLLLTQHVPDAVWEIVYFGVAPEFRGQGLGRAILVHGLEMAQRADALELILAVDIRNIAAIRLYEELGFRTFEQRIINARLP